MKHIQLFESFKSKHISSIEIFLKKVNDRTYSSFLNSLINISIRSDIPLSTFKGEYMNAKKAILVNSKTDDIVKLWFSLDNGFIDYTMNNKNGRYGVEGVTDYEKDFTSNNVLTDYRLDRFSWRPGLFRNKYNIFSKAEYALIINLSELDKGLSKLKQDRSKNKALPRIDDRFYRSENQKRYRQKSKKALHSEKVKDMLNYLLRNSSSSGHIIKNVIDVYESGEILLDKFYDIVTTLYYSERYRNNRFTGW